MESKGDMNLHHFYLFCCLLSVAYAKVVSKDKPKKPYEVKMTYNIDQNKLRTETLNGGCRRKMVKGFMTDTLNRNCTSKKMRIYYCEGHCTPAYMLNQVHGSLDDILKQNRVEYKCEPGRTKTKKVKITCPDDNTEIVYKVNVVKTCECKRQIRTKT